MKDGMAISSMARKISPFPMVLRFAAIVNSWALVSHRRMPPHATVVAAADSCQAQEFPNAKSQQASGVLVGRTKQ